MQSKVFVQSVQQRLKPIAPIVLPNIIKKQLLEVGATEESLTPELAEKFIKRMELALEMFLGPEGSKMARQMMLKELRRCAPEHFKPHSLT
jgi:hypothetical protein